jgi:hypothetical protein
MEVSFRTLSGGHYSLSFDSRARFSDVLTTLAAATPMQNQVALYYGRRYLRPTTLPAWAIRQGTTSLSKARIAPQSPPWRLRRTPTRKKSKMKRRMKMKKNTTKRSKRRRSRMRVAAKGMSIPSPN